MRLPIDADRLYLGADPVYEMWVRAVVEETAAIQREAHEKQQQEG